MIIAAIYALPPLSTVFICTRVIDAIFGAVFWDCAARRSAGFVFAAVLFAALAVAAPRFRALGADVERAVA